MNDTPPRHELAYMLLGALFAAIILISTIASSKIIGVSSLVFDAGTLLFPVSYIIGAILTEYYGVRRARWVVFAGMIAQCLALSTFLVVGILPAQADWHNQEAYMTILGFVPQIALASIVAYVVAELLNIGLIDRLKRATRLSLHARVLLALVIAQLVDTILFSLIAFSSSLPAAALIELIVSVYLVKVISIVFLTPLAFLVVNRVLRKNTT